MIKNRQAEAGETPLPLFYKDPILLRFEDHRDVGLASAASFEFAREAVAVPLCTSEFAVAMRHYPIVFAMDDNASPVGIVAIKRGHNLFVERDGKWKPGSYVPAYVRRYPFIAAETVERARQTLAIDRGSDRFVESCSKRGDGERLFDDSGKPTSTAEAAMKFCHAYHALYENTVVFGRALIAAKVLTPYHADFRLPDGSQHRVNGFYAVDEQAFRALPTKTVADWHTKGWLSLVALHLASLQSFQTLLDLNAQRANERKKLA